MSEWTPGNLDPVDPAPVAVAEPPAADPAAPAPAEDPDHVPEAVEVRPGEKMVPLSAVIALRRELREVKPLATQAAQLRQELDQARPYVDFLKTNQHLMQPPAPPPPAPVPQSEDPALIELARTFELYDPTTGQPDTARAARIREMTRTEASAIAEARIAPIAATTNESRAAANVQHTLGTIRDADGRAIEERFVIEALAPMVQGQTREKVMALLANPDVVQTVATLALGRQAMAKRSAPPAPGPALHVETAGGPGAYTMTDSEKRLARETGRTEAQWAATATKFNPAKSNVLE